MKHKSGFTLIELSIVLVIIGLIVGGILAGQELLKQATLKKVIAEQQGFETAINVYRDKFRALPGDDPKAYNYFGDACGDNTSAFETGCNGNGDGIIGTGAGPESTEGEGPKFFEHLSRAGLIGKELTGNCLAAGPESCGLDATNSPVSSFKGGLWGAMGGGCNNCVNLHDKNVIALLHPTRNDGTALCKMSVSQACKIMPVIDLFTIESKIDDGLPNAGKLMTYGDGTADYNCVSDDDPESRYNLTRRIFAPLILS